MDALEFIEGVNKKNDRALKKLYDHYYASLCGYVEKLLNDSGIAEDIVQECLIKVWNTDVTFSDIKALSAWLYKSVYHAAVSALRERVSLERLQDGSPLLENEEESAQTLALREEVITYFYEILNQLPGQQRDILLYTLQGHKVQDIASMLSVSENSVKTQKKRAYQYIREHFDTNKLHVLLTMIFPKNQFS